MFKRLLFFLSLSLTSLVSYAENLTVTFGIYGSDRLSEIERKFHPLLKSLEDSLTKSTNKSVEIKMIFYNRYEDGINAVARGEVDIARLGAVSYVLAKKQNPGISIIATETFHNKKTFNGVICVNSKSTINSLKDLKGKSFAFANQRSTSGRYMSQQFLYENNIIASSFSKYGYFLKHGEVAMAVAQGRYDAGVFKDEILKNKIISKVLRVIATFPVVTHPWVASENLPGDLKVTIQQSLLNLEDKSVFKGLERDGFALSDNFEYDKVRLAVENNHLFFNDN
ncbi:MAG: phosphate/phosphite/phosphonate ABC transporter substrate-binding protein [Gammaproteobacteria bacterium]|nr:phosphate/phosphite/phosphonate ABC transporter substrate-binding protein [Gammaproteobacteria bacterium]